MGFPWNPCLLYSIFPSISRYFVVRGGFRLCGLLHWKKQNPANIFTPNLVKNWLEKRKEKKNLPPECVSGPTPQIRSQNGELQVFYEFKGWSIKHKNWSRRSMNIGVSGITASRSGSSRLRRYVSGDQHVSEIPTTFPASLSQSPSVIQSPKRRAGQGRGRWESPSPCPGEGSCHGLECLQGQGLQKHSMHSYDKFFCHSLSQNRLVKNSKKLALAIGLRHWTLESNSNLFGHLAKHKVAVNVDWVISIQSIPGVFLIKQVDWLWEAWRWWSGVEEWMVRKKSCFVHCVLPSGWPLGCASFTFCLHIVTREAHLSQWTLLFTSPTGFSFLLLKQGHTWQVVYEPSYLMRILQLQEKCPHKIN